MKITELCDVTFSYYQREPVLRGIDFAVEPGAVVGLLGRNGAGKTTLLRLLMGLMRPASGTVRVFGLDPVEAGAEVKRRVGYISEEQILPGYLSVASVIAMHRELFPGWDEEFERSLLRRFGIAVNRRIADLSKGESRQVALLCAVAHRPELLVLDEPGGGIDAAMRREFLETAITLLAQAGSTIVFSSHHVSDVERLADRIVVIDAGQVALESTLDDLKEKHCVLSVDGDRALGARLEATADCLRVRRVGREVRAVFAASSDAVGERLAATLPEAMCQSVPLEELFIELVGRES